MTTSRRAIRGARARRRVSRCISLKYNEGWPHKQAIAACLNMERTRARKAERAARKRRAKRRGKG